MSKLALWGAVAGAAEGAEKNIENRRKSEEADLDEQREIRLKELEDRLRGGREAGNIKERGAQAEALQAKQQSFTAGESEKTRSAKSEEERLSREHEAAQSELDRASEERMNDITAGSKGSGKRWEFKTSTQTRTGEGGIPEQYDVVSLSDKGSGRTFVQKGSRFIPQGTEPGSIRRAPRAAIADLLANTDQADAFLEAYNYLPIEFFGAVQAQKQ